MNTTATNLDLNEWLTTTFAAAHTIDSFRLVHVELARRLQSSLAQIDFSWVMNPHENLWDAKARPLRSART